MEHLNIVNLLLSIEHLQYVLIKTDVPYMPLDFPQKIAIGKDLDILCKYKHFNKLYKTCIDFSEKYKNKFIVKKINIEDKLKIRFEKNKKLYYQIDISYNYITKNFVENIINRRIRKNIYYIPCIDDELIIRKHEYKKNKNKTWHLKYIQEHEK